MPRRRTRFVGRMPLLLGLLVPCMGSDIRCEYDDGVLVIDFDD